MTPNSTVGERKFLSFLVVRSKVAKTYSREHGVAREELKADPYLEGPIPRTRLQEISADVQTKSRNTI